MVLNPTLIKVNKWKRSSMVPLTDQQIDTSTTQDKLNHINKRINEFCHTSHFNHHKSTTDKCLLLKHFVIIYSDSLCLENSYFAIQHKASKLKLFC